MKAKQIHRYLAFFIIKSYALFNTSVVKLLTKIRTLSIEETFERAIIEIGDQDLLPRKAEEVCLDDSD